MRRKILYFAALTALICALCGCEFVFNNEHISVEPHIQSHTVTEMDMIEISNSTQLYNAVIDLVESGAQQGIISVDSFSSGSLRFYIDQAIQRAQKSNAMCAYAVESITYEIGTRTGKTAVAFTIRYRYELSHILRIDKVSNMDAAITFLQEAMVKCEEYTAVCVTEYEASDIAQLLEAYAYANADLVMQIPQITESVYPDTGDERIVSVHFAYNTDTEELLRMQSAVEPVFTAAELYVRSATQVREKYAQLYSFLMERSDYSFESSDTAAYSLLVDGYGDCESFARVYEAMCNRAGLECHIIHGTRDGEPWVWNVINFRGAYYHLDLLTHEHTGGFSPKSKSEMVGYTWDESEFLK